MTRTAVARAPGRVNLVGEHTDYNDGVCLPIALPQDTVARVSLRAGDRISITSAQQASVWTGDLAGCGPGRVDGWVAYVAGVLWALDQEGYDVPPGLDVHVTGTVPLGAGLSSSASLEVAVAVGVLALTGRRLDESERRRLVQVCRRAETEVAGAPTGGLDQSAALLTEPGCALLLDFQDGSTATVPLGWTAAGLELVVIDTGVSHALTAGDYGARRRECEDAALALGLPSLRDADEDAVRRLADATLRRRAAHVVSENARVLSVVAALDRGSWTDVGELFTASHASLRDAFEVSCPELDLAVDTALAAGALGARMTGGGFGGSAIALLPADRVDAVRRAVDTAYADAGFRAPRHLDAPASAAARVVEVSG
ncbi:galactokinase [Nocardioides sp.]|uniref:galactokinase n=1 Tax=Nocardioides sp. TaxID=35761 RepID=UPI002614EF40|nr:galactokinase [Nocardioides sp.]